PSGLPPASVSGKCGSGCPSPPAPGSPPSSSCSPSSPSRVRARCPAGWRTSSSSWDGSSHPCGRGELRISAYGSAPWSRCVSRARSPCSSSPDSGPSWSASPCSWPGCASCAVCPICFLTSWPPAPPRSTPRLRLRTSVVLVVLILACVPAAAFAQGGDVEFLWGRWYSGNRATTYEIRSGHWSAQALIHNSLGRRRAFYGFGWGMRVLQRSGGFAPYFTTGVSLGLSTDTVDQALAALWDIGGGVEWRPI